MAPKTKKGSAPATTASGSGASGGSWVRSRSHAKNRRNGRRCSVTWSRIVPRSTGYLASSASSTDARVTRPPTSSCTSSRTCARVRRWGGRTTRITAGSGPRPTARPGDPAQWESNCLPHRRAGVPVGRCGRQLDSHCAGSPGRAVGRGPDPAVIRVVLPPHLRTLAQVRDEVQLDVGGRVTRASVLDALEARYPVLRGTIRDHVTLQRRPFLRFFACERDLTHEPPDAPLPDAVVAGAEPFFVLGAIAGG